jgi:hypothetical protein
MALEQAWQESHPLVMVGVENSGSEQPGERKAGAQAENACGPDGCAI